MELYHIIILALVQGITEFLPVSSSGHLVLAHFVMDGGVSDLCWDQNRTIDIAVHLGTLFSVLLYFRKDLLKMACGLRHPGSSGFRLLKMVVTASIPVIIAGYALHKLQPSFLCLLEITAWMTVIFGIVLWLADRTENKARTVENIGLRDALIIGLAQILALIPGVSRSGITMSAARFLGFSRTESAHFSLLLAIIAISGAAFLSGLDVMHSGDELLAGSFATAIILSFVAGWVAIRLMMGWLKRASFMPFVIYRLLFGGALLALIYSGALA